MMEVKPACHRGQKATESGRNGNEAVANAASEAFARQLHHRYAPVELPTAGGISLAAR